MGHVRVARAYKYPRGERTPGNVWANSTPPGVPGIPFRVVVGDDAFIVMEEERMDVVVESIIFLGVGRRMQFLSHPREISESRCTTSTVYLYCTSTRIRYVCTVLYVYSYTHIVIQYMYVCGIFGFLYRMYDCLEPAINRRHSPVACNINN